MRRQIKKELIKIMIRMFLIKKKRFDNAREEMVSVRVLEGSVRRVHKKYVRG
jgi:hypothetical protein